MGMRKLFQQTFCFVFIVLLFMVYGEAVSDSATFAIKDEKFKADFKGECNTDAIIVDVKGNSFTVKGTMSIRSGKSTLWCYGAMHTWTGKLAYEGYTFASDKKDPLKFRLDKDKGYVYISGKGTVTFPNGKVIKLPYIQYDSDYITRIQLILKDKGYNPGPVDGKWGNKTESALRKYQSDTELSVTGKLDAQTKKSLEPLFVKTYTKPETRIPLSKDDVVKIESISAIVGQGEASFSKTGKPGILNARVNGTIPVVDGKSCLFCVKTIKIEPNMKVPLSPFFMPNSQEGNSITLNNISLTGPGASDDTTEYILSGKNGATLQKESNGFILLEGEAYYVKNVDSKGYMATNKTDKTTKKDPSLSGILLPPFTLSLKGNNEVRVRNPNDFNVTVGLRSEKSGRDFQVVANGVASVFVPNGKYEIYFIYSNKPDALFKGDDFSLNGNGVEIKIVKVVGGNYGIKRIK